MKTDNWILQNQHMLTPFIDHSVKTDGERKVMSYGLSCVGYDLRLSEDIYHLPTDSAIDPKKMSLSSYDKYEVQTDEDGARFIWLKPGLTLASSVEHLAMPRDAGALVKIKSSYARVGVTVLDPILEPEWRGNITISIINTNTCDVKLYLGEGTCQIVFFGTEGEVNTSYEDRGGKYQDSKGVAITRM